MDLDDVICVYWMINVIVGENDSKVFLVWVEYIEYLLIIDLDNKVYRSMYYLGRCISSYVILSDVCMFS